MDCSLNQVEVVSCGDPVAGHGWQGQRVQMLPANFVTAAQQQDFPSRSACPEIKYLGNQWGMDMVWQFFSRYPLPAGFP